MIKNIKRKKQAVRKTSPDPDSKCLSSGIGLPAPAPGVNSCSQSRLDGYFRRCYKHIQTKAEHVECPACQKYVSKRRINNHLDNQCQYRMKTTESREQSNADMSCMDSESTEQCGHLKLSSVVSSFVNDLSTWRMILNPFNSTGELKRKKANRAVESPESLKEIKGVHEVSPEINVVLKHSKENSTILSPDGAKGGSNIYMNGSDPPEADKMKENNINAQHLSKACIPRRTSNDAETVPLPSEAMSTSETTTLTPYYITNFAFVIETILYDVHFQNLFNADDMNVVAEFRQLSEKSQQLYVRLFLRKNQWFKVKKLIYPDISECLAPHLLELLEKGFLLGIEHLDDLEEILNLLAAPDVRALAQFCQQYKDKNGKKLSSKKEYMSAIQHHLEKQVSVLSYCRKSQTENLTVKASVLKRAKFYLGDCVKLSEKPRDLFDSCFKLYSMINYSHKKDDNPNQATIYRILQMNRGDVVYPTYSIQREADVFVTKQELVKYSIALHLEQEFSSFMENRNFDRALEIYVIAKKEVDTILLCMSSMEYQPRRCFSLPEYLRKFSAEWIYFRICGKSVEALEKKDRYEEAVKLLEMLLQQNIFCNSSRGILWERIVIDTERYLKNTEQAFEHMKNALADHYVRTGKRLNICHKVTKISNAANRRKRQMLLAECNIEILENVQQNTISAPIFLDTSSCQRTIFLSHQDQGGDTFVKSLSDVENYVLLHYSDAGYPEGVHGEGSPYAFIFSLLFWDIIFMDVADVFLGPFQPCPLDLFTDFFYENRRKSIDARLNELGSSSKEQLRSLVYQSWLKNQGRICVGVNWTLFSCVEQLMGLVACLGSRLIAGICELFCKDYSNRASGMPDLLVWNPKKGTCKAIEVKGPGDRLAFKQIIWLNVLRSLGMDAEVCYVKGISGKRKTKTEE